MQASGSCVTAGHPRQVGGEVRCLGGAHARLVGVGIVFPEKSAKSGEGTQARQRLHDPQ
jgi:hypothetical protein